MNSKKRLTKRLALFGDTDLGNARRFAARAEKKFIYCEDRSTWFRWTGKRWRECKVNDVMRFAMDVASKIADEATYISGNAAKAASSSFARRSQNRAALDNMVHLAKSQLAVKTSVFDRHPFLLNVENGTLDLKTCTLRPHRRSDYLTQMIRVPYDPMAKCPIFKTYLRQALPNKGSCQCIQRCVGYTLTGDIREQVFFILYGPGGSGKSVFTSVVLRGLLGEYGAGTSSNTFMVKAFDNGIPNDLAALNGRRGIVVSEVNAGKQFDEARIKGWTGGDEQSARFMRAEFFDFMPQGKLWMALNDLPRVRETDGAFWRRVRIFPFPNKLKDEDMDTDLSNKIRAELPGILAWAVRGCERWLRDGDLAEDPCMKTARDGYQSKVDHFDAFIRDCCNVGEGKRAGAKGMFAAYANWCHSAKESAYSQPQFKAKMQSKDFTYKRGSKERFWLGIGLSGEI